jgi:hypothetical protein
VICSTSDMAGYGLQATGYVKGPAATRAREACSL